MFKTGSTFSNTSTTHFYFSVVGNILIYFFAWKLATVSSFKSIQIPPPTVSSPFSPFPLLSLHLNPQCLIFQRLGYVYFKESPSFRTVNEHLFYLSGKNPPTYYLRNIEEYTYFLFFKVLNFQPELTAVQCYIKNVFTSYPLHWTSAVQCYIKDVCTSYPLHWTPCCTT